MVDALLGDRPFSYFGESFVGSHVGTYLAAKRPQQVRRPPLARTALFFRSLADVLSPAGQGDGPRLSILRHRVRLLLHRTAPS